MISAMKRLAFIVIVGHFALPSLAQEQPSGRSEEMTALAWLIGEWKGDVSMTVPGASEKMSMTCNVSVKWYGPYQETVYTMEMPGMPKFTGHEFLTFDLESKTYKGWAFDDNVNVPREESGSLEGKKFSLLSKAHGGMVTRTTFENKGEDSVGFLIELQQDQGFMKLGEATFKRKK